MTQPRIAVTGIIAEDRTSAQQINAILSEYGDYIVGRMGIPYRTRGVNVISVIIDAPQEIINAFTGKLGSLKGVSAKTLMGKIRDDSQKSDNHNSDN